MHTDVPFTMRVGTAISNDCSNRSTLPSDGDTTLDDTGAWWCTLLTGGWSSDRNGDDLRWRAQSSPSLRAATMSLKPSGKYLLVSLFMCLTD